MHCRQHERAPFSLLRVGLFFVACALSLHMALWFLIPVQTCYPLQKGTADVVTLLLNLLGIKAVCSGVTVTLPHGQWEVALECTSLSALIVFLSFIIAYPSSVRSKIVGNLVGLPLLMAANILRLVLLGWATAHLPRIAHYLHDYVWQIGFLILVAFLWIVWIDQVVKREFATDLPA